MTMELDRRQLIKTLAVAPFLTQFDDWGHGPTEARPDEIDGSITLEEIPDWFEATFVGVGKLVKVGGGFCLRIAPVLLGRVSPTDPYREVVSLTRREGGGIEHRFGKTAEELRAESQSWYGVIP